MLGVAYAAGVDDRNHLANLTIAGVARVLVSGLPDDPSDADIDMCLRGALACLEEEFKSNLAACAPPVTADPPPDPGRGWGGAAAASDGAGC